MEKAAKEIQIDYEPRDWALEWLHDNKTRWKVYVVHRRAGKTTAALNHLQRDALMTANSRWAYIAPTYKQAKNIAWDILKHYTKDIPAVDVNESELSVKYANGSKITLYGSDNPDSLRGIGLWGVVFDEYSQQPSNIFTEIIRPSLADHDGYAIWIGTPKGKNEFYRLYQMGRKKSNEDWFSVSLSIDDTKIISDEELKDAKKIMSPDEFNQEWYCSFEAAIKGAIYGSEIAQARKSGHIKPIGYEREALVHTFWDIGVGPNLAIGFYQRIANEVHKIDYWEGTKDEGIIDAIAIVRNRGYLYGKHYAPHDIEAKELSTGKTRKQIAHALNFEFEVVPNIGVQEGIDAAKRMWSHLWVDSEKCQLWLDYIAQYQREWDDRRGMFRDNPRHDFTSHAADEFRYAAVMEKQIVNQQTKIKWKQPAYEPMSPNEFVTPSGRVPNFGSGKHNYSPEDWENPDNEIGAI